MNTVKTILVTGANGQLGMEFRTLAGDYSGIHFLFVSKEELSVIDEAAVENYFSKHKLDYCINCAAYTAVDMAEKDMGVAYSANAVAVGYLAKACKRRQVKFIHISTDYVFAGNALKPYTETDETDPLNYYGYTKLQGEKKVFVANEQSIIIRTSWVYSSFGKNFVKTMIRLMNEKESIGVVADQFGCPTYAADLALAIMQIISSEKFVPGIYHYCNKGIISWHEFALEIKELIHSKCTVNAITTEDYPTPAKRPHYSAFDTSKIEQTYGLHIPMWQDSLRRCIVLMKT